MLKRVFDILFSLLVLIFISPFFIIVAIFIKFTSKGPVFYRQIRVGKNGIDFRIFKFRTMFTDSDKGSLITVGGRDKRITSLGYWLRRYKLDELPQFLNVLVGEMSIVGPRPEVRRYVEMYNKEQFQVLSVRPGITDYASVKFSNESELLALAYDAETEYVNNIMPAKLQLNLEYIRKRSFAEDLKIIIQTVGKIVTLH
jgi:lipopolysaccharide/colanic/teichoic acid biosynthesis glycosyltransferase